MSDIDGDISIKGFDTTDHQPAYVYTPDHTEDDGPARPVKRRKVAKSQGLTKLPQNARTVGFEPLFDGVESSDCTDERKALFERSWSATESRIQSVLVESNEGTLAEVATFVNEAREAEDINQVAAGFVVTGPNITSQGLLFDQLSTRLINEIKGPVVVLRSGDASNLKASLKKLIRDATNQKSNDEEDEGLSSQKDGRKLLNYDLEILHEFVKANDSQAVVIAFQDSEAFDASLVADLIVLFSSWKDRIPFILLFGIATSVELFHERLSRSASRCLYGHQFDIEQTSSLLERVFMKAVASADAPLRQGASFVSSLLERQEDHVQSVQSFIAALKYAYMCHFYGNPLSILTDTLSGQAALSRVIQPQHIELIRMLPSFQKLVDGEIEKGRFQHTRDLIQGDKALIQEVANCLESRQEEITHILRAMHLLAQISAEPISRIELYMTAFQGTLSESEYVRSVLESIKRLAPEDLLEFCQTARQAMVDGCPEMELAAWAAEGGYFFDALSEIHSQVFTLIEKSEKSGKPVRSSYAIHSKGVRTTVIAQRVQLSYEKSSLSEQDKEFTSLVDRLSEVLLGYVTLDNPQDMFLNEVWLYNSTTPYHNFFTPRPRAAIERALSAPYDYLNCECCEPLEGLSSTHPATAILYQMYLETGSLINIFDLWSAFFEMIAGGEEQKMDERDALVLFYRALADLKALGMVKQSKKKADHLAKVAWKGL